MPQTRLKPLSPRVIVITGASSGLATARMASEAGARVCLISGDGEALERIVGDLRSRGGKADHAVADVADQAAMEAAAARAETVFGGIDAGGIDAGVNDAGGSVYGTLAETPIEDQRRLFETNYWGVVRGSLIAAKTLRGQGGASVNIGSVLADRAIMFRGTYSASEHAVTAFTDALRMELEAEGAPISVTLIMPSGIETAFPEHARNRLDSPGIKAPPPANDPRLAARAIPHACTHRKRDIVVGFAGHAISLLGAYFPRATDPLTEAIADTGQTSDKAPRPDRADSLYAPRGDGTEKSLSRPVSPVRQTSLFLEAQLHPAATAAALAGLGAMVAGALVA